MKGVLDAAEYGKAANWDQQLLHHVYFNQGTILNLVKLFCSSKKRASKLSALDQPENLEIVNLNLQLSSYAYELLSTLNFLNVNANYTHA